MYLSEQKQLKNKVMKIPKYIRLNYYYINRKPIFYLTVCLLLILFCGNLALNIINFIFN